ncbi:hypothetical protein OQA88_2482 [Cercophora sp. LCS_1]
MFGQYVVLTWLVGVCIAQLPPKPEGVTVLKSKFHENVTISYKEPKICETTPDVKSFAGYVHLPPHFLEDGDGESQDYPINTFFWFFEARKNPSTAPLAIWLNGGPGGSSLMGLLEENGPCFIASDSKTTMPNPWSWNNEVNMLYIDQPNQVGFSYDIPTNVTLRPTDFGLGWEPIPADFSNGIPTPNYTQLVGTVSSQKLSQTANTTAFAAHALWHFVQTWFFEFPHYKPSDNRISLWSESYGGHYSPGFFGFFQTQNEKITNGTSTEKGAHKLHLDTLGIVNGLIDVLVQGEYDIHFGYNNTYGIQLFNESYYHSLLDEWTRPGGCRSLIENCRSALRSPTPNTTSCALLEPQCSEPLLGYILHESGRSYYDIAHPTADPFPPPHFMGYLTHEHVLSALGVPVNFSMVSLSVGQAFDSSFDYIVGGFLESIAHLLENGVGVHLMYGDRDFACNWLGGEAASLAVPWARQDEFKEAGYEGLVVDGEVKGLTRQVGKFSFSRVFQAGHEVPAYQPEAAYEVFMRAMKGRDVATGQRDAKGVVTGGRRDAWTRSEVPEWPGSKCYVLKTSTCKKDIWERVVKGEVEVRDWFVVDEEEEMRDL